MAIVALGTSSTAEAAVKLRVTSAADTITIEDGDVNDGAAVPNNISYGGSNFGDFSFHVTLANASDSVQPDLMHLRVSAASAGAGDLKVEFTKTDLDFETLQLYISWGGSLAAGGDTDYAAYYDTANVEFAATTLIGDAHELSKWGKQSVDANPDMMKARRRVNRLRMEFALCSVTATVQRS